MLGWNYSVSDIPNVEGAIVDVLLKTGLHRLEVKIVKDNSGCHVLEDIPISWVQGWRMSKTGK